VPHAGGERKVGGREFIVIVRVSLLLLRAVGFKGVIVMRIMMESTGAGIPSGLPLLRVRSVVVMCLIAQVSCSSLQCSCKTRSP
jgi:hypothetical protein